ncbi:MAG: hypothetical protein ACE5MI_00770 [Acidimicrobiia bacterium]
MEAADARLVGFVLLSIVIGVVVEAIGSGRGKFTSAFWRLPLDDKLDHIAQHRNEWWLMGSTWVAILGVLTAGMVGLAWLLAASGQGTLAWVSLGAYLIGVGAWLWGIFVQTPVTWTAASQRRETGSTPGWLQPFWLAAFMAELSFLILTNLAYAGMGVAIIASSFPAVWAGWVAVGLGVLIPVGVVISRAGFPHLALMAPIVFAVALLIEGF